MIQIQIENRRQQRRSVVIAQPQHTNLHNIQDQYHREYQCHFLAQIPDLSCQRFYKRKHLERTNASSNIGNSFENLPYHNFNKFYIE